jgi:membrane associated rhomboid family serine protease
VTAILIVVNVFVFAAFQSKDDHAYEQAVAYYKQVRLDSDEVPAYADWMREHGRAKDVDEFVELPPELHAQVIESDPKFLKALDTDQIIKPDAKGYASWKERRAKFEEIRDSAFTEKHMLRFSHFEPDRIFSSMFLHGGMEHLIGNMVFLALLGLLVEGALGSGWYLALYLLGGIGAALTSLAVHYNGYGGAIGASGAIAALMGAYCVIWGRRKVRVFYWAFVFFDYVKVPALVLLPVWLGWQLLNWWLDHDSHVAFDEHAGGIVFGALIAWGLQHKGWMRHAFIEEDEREEARAGNVKAFDDAMQLLGRLEIPRARDMLMRIDEIEPGKLPVVIALYRCARYKGTPAEVDAAITRVLTTKPRDIAELRDIKTTYDDYVKACGGTSRLAPEIMVKIVPLWLRLNDEVAVEAVLRAIAERAPDYAGLPGAWFAFAMRAPEKSSQRRARLEHVVQLHGQSDFASKARFLLTQA